LLNTLFIDCFLARFLQLQFASIRGLLAAQGLSQLVNRYADAGKIVFECISFPNPLLEDFMRRLLLSVIVLCGSFPAMLSAQDKTVEKRKFGLTFPNIGIIWHISDKVAFVPDINLTHGWSEIGSNSGDSTTNSVTVNAALRFYLHNWKGMRFYLSPKYGYGWSNVETSSSLQGVSYASELHNHSVSGAWGLEYAVSDRISLFGDIGVRYMHGKTDSSSQFSSDTKSNMVGTVGTWGLILYLK
jgi:hypothetical protein